MWENSERLFAAGTPQQLDGDTLYVQAYVGFESQRVAALDVSTGAVRWRTEGYLRMANAGHVLIQDARPTPPSFPFRILDATGRVGWRSDSGWTWVRGDVAYVSVGEPSLTLTAIDLPTNRVMWRRTDVTVSEGDDHWLYGRTATDELAIIDRMTGDLVGEMQLGQTSADQLVYGAPVIRIGSWLFALGPLSAPEPRKPVVVRGCLTVMGCPGNSYAPSGARVTIDRTTVATTDRRGCFQTRAELGLGPARVEVTSGTGKPLELDGDFPRAVVFDGSPVALTASYIGGGCHDSQPGGFP